MRLDEQLIYQNSAGSIVFSALGVFHAAQVTGLDSVVNTIYGDVNVGQDGEDEVGSRLEPRYITIMGYIRKNEIDNANKLIGIVNPKQIATLTYRSEKYTRKITCRPEAVPTITEPNEFSVLSQYLVALRCSDPYWRDVTGSRIDIAAWLPAFRWPLIIPPGGIIYGYREPSLIKNILNPGHVPAAMTVVFTASSEVVNPSITNIATQQYIKMLYTMQAGDMITIDTARGRATLNRGGVETNLFNYFDFDADPDMKLNVGDNLLRYNADSGIEQLEASIYPTPLYLGVH